MLEEPTGGRYDDGGLANVMKYSAFSPEKSGLRACADLPTWAQLLRGTLVAMHRLNYDTISHQPAQLVVDSPVSVPWRRFLVRSLVYRHEERRKFTGYDQTDIADTLYDLFNNLGNELSSDINHELYSQLQIRHYLQYDTRVDLIHETEVRIKWQSLLTRRRNSSPAG